MSAPELFRNPELSSCDMIFIYLLMVHQLFTLKQSSDYSK